MTFNLYKLSKIDYIPQYSDADHWTDSYWDESLYDKKKLQFKCVDYPPTDDEDDPEIDENKLSRALIKLWLLKLEINTPEETEDSLLEAGTQEINDLLNETALLHVFVGNKPA